MNLHLACPPFVKFAVFGCLSAFLSASSKISIVMRRVVKSVGAGIGLATEAYAARKSSSASHTAAGLQSTTTDVPSAGQHDGEHEEHLPRPEIDEAGWDLDDAVDEQEGAEAEENETGKTTMSVDHLV